MDYGGRLKHARKSRKLTQDELAAASGVKQALISRIERGDQKASTFDMDLALALKVNPVWLSRGIGGMELVEAQAVLPPQLTFIDAEVWKTFSPTARIFVEDLIVKIKDGDIKDDGIRVLSGMVEMMKKASLSHVI
jgi:transcriptional regulator with XRE-family HTH domain